MKRIVIIGGMGPQASLELHRRILMMASERGAVDNDDFPEIVHLSIPVPDFISSGDKEAGLARIRNSLQMLSFRPDDQVILACNTAHVLLPDIERICGVSLLSLINAAASAIDTSAGVGIMASPTTIKSGLYSKPLASKRLKLILPDEHEVALIETAIRAILANRPLKEASLTLKPILRRLERSGAERIILGCTELSVIFGGVKDKVLIDPLDEVCKLIEL